METPICEKCVYYVINKRKSYCEEDMWPETDTIKAKLYNPVLFDCFNFESRKNYINNNRKN